MKGQPSWMGLVPSQEVTGEASSLSAMWGYSKKMVVYKPGREFSARTILASTLMLDFPASKCVWDIAVFLSHPGCGISVMAPWTKTPTVLQESLHLQKSLSFLLRAASLLASSWIFLELPTFSPQDVLPTCLKQTFSFSQRSFFFAGPCSVFSIRAQTY